jgi:hypothetical protein
MVAANVMRMDIPAHVTNVLTMPVTIFAALEDSSHDFSSGHAFSIRLIGSTGREFYNLSLLKEILHLTPSLQNLKFVSLIPSLSTAQTEGATRST